MLLRDIIGQEKLKQQLVEMVQHQRLSHALLFVGPEGSGALPLAIAFAQYLVSSPATTNEVLDMGLYEYIDNSALCLMEWSEKIEELLQNETKITIHIYFKNNQRLLECSLK